MPKNPKLILKICKNLNLGFMLEFEIAEAVAGIIVVYATNMCKIMYEE
jgi:hypothetical protein